VTRDEIGRRQVAVLEADGDSAPTADLRHIETFHHDELALTVTPGEEDDALDRIRETAASWTGRDVRARIEVDGFLAADEAAFAAAIDDALANAAEEQGHEDDPPAGTDADAQAATDADAQAATDADAQAGHEIAVENRTRSVEAIRAHPLYREFEDRLDPETAVDAARRDDYDPEQFAADVREAVLAALAELDAEGDLS